MPFSHKLRFRALSELAVLNIIYCDAHIENNKTQHSFFWADSGATEG